MKNQELPKLLDTTNSLAAFRAKRRQKFLSAEGYARNLKWTQTSIEYLSGAIVHHLSEGNDSPIGQRGIFKDMLALTQLAYTAGCSIDQVAGVFSTAVSRLCQWYLDYQPHVRRVAIEANVELRDDATPIDFENLEAYQDVVCMVSLAVLLGSPAELQSIGDVVRRYRGEDILVDSLFDPVRLIASNSTEFFHLSPYDPLIDAFYTAETPTEASASVKRYLDAWYPAFSGCSWHDGHLVKKEHMSPYNGYWSFEAAAVCVIHDIDDSSFRDHLVYPKDLADWARENGSIDKLKTFARTQAANGPRLRCQGGKPCPQAGVWQTPADPSATRAFAFGELMPELRSDYGVTIWQLEASQGRPPTL